MENYITHRDVLVHKRRRRFPFTLLILPLFIFLLAELLFIAKNRNGIQSVHPQNPYTAGVQQYVSPLASPGVGQTQIGVGGGPQKPTNTPTPRSY